MPLRARLAALLPLFLLVPGCSDNNENPFDTFSFSQAPGENAILLYVSGAWAEEPGRPRELFALNSDGSTDRLTSCTQRSQPCDFLQVAPSLNPARLVAVRGAIGGDPEASALFFVDLDRSVETIIAIARRVQSADWGFDEAFVTYSTGELEDVWFVRPNGEEDRILIDTPFVRERYARIAFDSSAVVYEQLESTPGKSGLAFLINDGSTVGLTEGGPGTEVLPDSPYIVGSDSGPAFSPDQQRIVFRRLTGTGNGGLGTWDILTTESNSSEDEPIAIVSGGDVHRSVPDWDFITNRIVFVETDTSTNVASIVTVNPDGSDRQVLHSEDAGFMMGSPRWLR